MSNPLMRNANPFRPRSPAFGYVLLCLASLLVLFLVLLQQRQPMLVNWVILLVGTGGVVVQLPLAPAMLLVLVTAAKLLSQMSVGLQEGFLLPSVFSVSDVLLCAAVLGYVASHFRLQALGTSILPPDPRASAPGKAKLKSPKKQWSSPARWRAPALVLPGEQSLLVASLPFWALAAQLAWQWLARPRNVLEWSTRAAQFTVCLVVLALGLVVMAALFDYARRRRMTADEAVLLLQETLWKETRGEQRWFTRWLAWFRLTRSNRDVLDP